MQMEVKLGNWGNRYGDRRAPKVTGTLKVTGYETIHPYLTVHESTYAYGWTVTHMWTGYALLHHLPDQRTAELAAAALSELFPWGERHSHIFNTRLKELPPELQKWIKEDWKPL